MGTATAAAAAAEAPGRSAVVTGIAVYCVAGTLLTLLNKVAIGVFPFTCWLIIAQNIVAILLLKLGAACAPDRLGPLPSITLPSLRQWGPVTGLFTVMLFTSLESLKHVSAVTLVVLRNLTTVVVAGGELVFLRTSLSPRAAVSVAGMLLGAVVYGSSDLSFSARGYVWLAVNVMASSAYQVYVKFLAKQEGMTPMGMSFLNNAISLPMLWGCSLALRENPVAWFLASRGGPATWALLLASGVLGYALSTSAFFLNQLISATSIMVANNSSKFAVILLSEALLQRSLGPVSAAGMGLVLWFAYLYAVDSRASTQPGGAKAGLGSLLAACVVALLCTGGSVLYATGGWGVTTPAVSSTDSLVGHVRVAAPLAPFTSNSKFELCTTAKASAAFKDCDKQDCSLPAPSNSTQPFNGLQFLGIPDRTSRNESVIDIIHQVLQAAWGPQPPRVDLFLRTGCHGASEAQYLFASVDVFWPRFLGEVVVVLDYADYNTSSHFIPARPNHNYRLAFEHVPCMPARIFNQVGYLMADMHSSADFIVTIDSDCLFHSPVTPDLLFRNGKVRLPHSKVFQAGLWDKHVEFFLGQGTFKWHTMVTQPVTFHRSTLAAYRAWFEDTKGKCYVDAVAEFVASGLDPSPFCWMCQLGTFLDVTNATRDQYELVDLDAGVGEPYQRLAVHTTWELMGLGNYGDASKAYVRQGVCRALGPRVLPECAAVNTAVLNQITYLYAEWPWPGPQGPKDAQLNAYQAAIQVQLRSLGYDV